MKSYFLFIFCVMMQEFAQSLEVSHSPPEQGSMVYILLVPMSRTAVLMESVEPSHVRAMENGHCTQNLVVSLIHRHS